MLAYGGPLVRPKQRLRNSPRSIQVSRSLLPKSEVRAPMLAMANRIMPSSHCWHLIKLQLRSQLVKLIMTPALLRLRLPPAPDYSSEGLTTISMSDRYNTSQPSTYSTNRNFVVGVGYEWQTPRRAAKRTTNKTTKGLHFQKWKKRVYRNIQNKTCSINWKTKHSERR